MRKILLFIFSTVLFCSFADCNAQTVEISRPLVQLKDSTITISYDILNSDETDKFLISLDIRDSEGKLINVKSINGDIGNNISGGFGKMISWDLRDDSRYRDAQLSFKVRAEVISPEKPEDYIAGNDTIVENDRMATVAPLNRNRVIASSLLFPGLGMYRLNKEEPHWIRGATAYSFIATSLVFHSIANKNFSNYQESINLQEREDYFNSANNQISISNTFLLSALGVWVIDFMWTMTGSKELKENATNNWTDNLSIEPSYNNEINTPTLAFKYNF